MAQIINLKFLGVNPKEPKEGKPIHNFKKAKAFSKLEELLDEEHNAILEPKSKEFSIQYYSSTPNIKRPFLKEIYKCLNNYLMNVPLSQKRKSQQKKTNYCTLYSVLSHKGYLKKKFTSFYKNYIYCFLMNWYVNKPDEWQKMFVLQS